MVTEESRRRIKKATTRIKAAETALETARINLTQELSYAHKHDKSSFQELGELVGLSRQRIHQLLQ